MSTKGEIGMTIDGRSPLAHGFVESLRSVPNRTSPVYGVAIHQTGSSLVTAAYKHGADPLEYAIQFYLNPQNYFPHYVVGYDGTIAQICDENGKALHIGFQPADRQACLDGSWTKKLPADLVVRWKTTWPAHMSPAHLFPGPSPNNVYVGIETIPIVRGATTADVEPMGVGLIYTTAQHESIAELVVDIMKRWDLGAAFLSGLALARGRLVGHEDVNPIQRHTKNPPAGWDPGALREHPWFDFPWVRHRVTELLTASASADPPSQASSAGDPNRTA